MWMQGHARVERMFDYAGLVENRRTPVNREAPERVPSRLMGDIPVIARLQWSDGSDELRAVRAIRCTKTHVMVGWRIQLDGKPVDEYAWLPARDVMRSGQLARAARGSKELKRVDRRGGRSARGAVVMPNV